MGCDQINSLLSSLGKAEIRGNISKKGPLDKREQGR